MIKMYIRFRLIRNLANNLGFGNEYDADVEDRKADY